MFSSENPKERPLIFHEDSNARIGMENPGFFRRGIAFFLDLWIVFLIGLFFIWLSLSAVRLALENDGFSTQGNPFLGPVLFTLFFLCPLLFVTYFSFLAWWGGQTLGKKLMSLKITSSEGGEVSMFQAVRRTLGYFFSFSTGGLGFLIVFFSHDRRAFHDWISGTRVVRLQ